MWYVLALSGMRNGVALPQQTIDGLNMLEKLNLVMINV